MANKSQVIEALAERLGDRKLAAEALDGLVDFIVRTVKGGERVTITGFGSFEKRARAARTARNPRTGETIQVAGTEIPAFRPGAMFREVVSGTRNLPRLAAERASEVLKAAAEMVAPADPEPVAAVIEEPAPGAPVADEPKKKAKKAKKSKKAEKAAVAEAERIAAEAAALAEAEKAAAEAAEKAAKKAAAKGKKKDAAKGKKKVKAKK